MVKGSCPAILAQPCFSSFLTFLILKVGMRGLPSLSSTNVTMFLLDVPYGFPAPCPERPCTGVRVPCESGTGSTTLLLSRGSICRTGHGPALRRRSSGNGTSPDTAREHTSRSFFGKRAQGHYPSLLFNRPPGPSPLVEHGRLLIVTGNVKKLIKPGSKHFLPPERESVISSPIHYRSNGWGV